MTIYSMILWKLEDFYIMDKIGINWCKKVS